MNSAVPLITVDIVSRNTAQREAGKVATGADGPNTSPVVAGYHKSIREQIVSAISDPNIALVLLIVGILCVYVEFTSPGMVAPGVVGGIAVLLALSALSAFPVTWSGAALIIIAFACFALEAKFATHGVSGLAGTVLMALGMLLLIDGPPETRIRPATAIIVSLPFAWITIFLMRLVVLARANKTLSEPEPQGTLPSPSRTPDQIQR